MSITQTLLSCKTADLYIIKMSHKVKYICSLYLTFVQARFIFPAYLFI